MHNTFTIKAANVARNLESMGLTYNNAIGMAAASCELPSHEIAKELQRRAAESRARNKKKNQEIAQFWKRINNYEN